MVEEFIGSKIGVLRGGPSSERQISLVSGEAVFKVLKKKNLDVSDVVIPDVKDLEFLRNWILKKLRREKIEVCFIALHGWFGEDGLLQDILEKENYYYSGSDSKASILAMDKIASKRVFEKNSIPIPRYKVVSNRSGFDINLSDFSFPLIVKPSSQGSSIGISKVNRREDLNFALQKAFSYNLEAIIEEFIPSWELTVGILENKPLPLIRIQSSLGLYNFKAKYTKGLTEYIVPADIEENVALEAQKIALKAHLSLGCNSFSRVDMLYSRRKNKLYVLEVNTIPGLTESSLLPKAARTAGIEFDELILKMLKSAYQREQCLKK